MQLVQLTHWRVDYIMNEISIGALMLLCSTSENGKPTGVLAGKDLTEDAGLKLKKD